MTIKDQKPKLNPVIYEEAADWIVELREGEVDAAMRERLDAWFRTSPEHIRAYLELSSIWEEGADPDLDRAHTTDELMALVRSPNNVVSLSPPAVSLLELRSEPPAQPMDTQHAVERAAASPKAVRDSLPRRRRRWRPVWLSSSALVCVAMALTLYVYNERNVTFATETGEQRFEKLIDGSTIELNSKSRVRIRFSAHERNVDLLEGQALFHVAKDASRPFIVHSDATLVRAVGTQFDVYRKPTGTVVTVVEGRVAVLSPWLESNASSIQNAKPEALEARSQSTDPSGGSSSTTQNGAGLGEPSLSDGAPVHALFLSAGEQVTVGAAEAPPQARHTDPVAVTAWTQHELVFDSTSLIDVAQEFNRYNTRRLVVEDPALQQVHITGIFSSADPSGLIKFLRTQRDLVVLESDRDIRVGKK